MISISTIITYYKSKYFAIGRTGAPKGPDQKEQQEVYDNAANALKGYSAQLLEASNGQSILNAGLAATITQQGLLTTQIGNTVEKMTFLEEREKNLIKKFQVGSATLMHRTKMYEGVQTALEATAEDMAKYRSILEETLPMSGKLFADIAANEGKDGGNAMQQKAYAANQYVKAEMAASHWIDKNTTLTTDQTEALKLYSAGQGKSLARTVNNIQALAKAYGNVEDPVKLQNVILSEIANTSADVRAQYSKMPMGLEKAVLKARQLGVSMDQVHKIGEGLLDIESSVGKELEYQLLSGQRLVKNGKSLTNAYREATLMGDADKSIQALDDILESQKNVLDGTNMYAKKALADQMGISTKELQMMHEKKKLQEEIKSKTGKDVDFDTMEEKDKEALKIELEKTDSELAKTMVDLSKKEAAMETPADTIKRQMQHVIDKGLTVHLESDYETREKNRKEAAEGKGGAGGYSDKAIKQLYVWMEKVNIQTQGQLTLKTDKRELIQKNVTALTEALPIIGKAFGDLVAQLSKYTETLTGKPIKVEQIPYVKSEVETTKQARGGILDGPSHAQGGIPTAFGELEGGEAVINKKSTKKFMPLLSSINEAEGGRSFAKGGLMDKETSRLRSNVSYITNNIVTKDNNDVNKQLMVLIDKIANMKTADTPNINTNEIIAAITRAMGSLKFDVNVSVDPLDPLKFKKEIEFRSGNLNSVSYK